MTWWPHRDSTPEYPDDVLPPWAAMDIPQVGLQATVLAAANPNPARITDAQWWFVLQLVAREPGTLIGGIYANKQGYHNTRSANEARWPGDYSIRDVEDRRGARDKAAAIDWTFPEAQRSDYRRMARYGVRLRAAYDSRDPRVSGWREALGQVDSDSTPEGLDFRHRITRRPDDTHRWHWHFSEDRDKVFSYLNKRALLSVLSGESLGAWQARREDDDMDPEQDRKLDNLDALNSALLSDTDVVRGVRHADGTLHDYQLALSQRVRQNTADIAEMKARPPGGIDPAVIKTALLDPDVLAAIARSVADEDHRRSAG